MPHPTDGRGVAMKRFIDSEMWKKPWFRSLPPRLKAFYIYVICQCDHAGVWDSDFGLASFFIGEEVTEVDMMPAFDGHFEKLPCGKWWLPTFCEWQYVTLSRGNRAHNPAFLSIEKHGLLDRLSDSLFDRDAKRDKVKDKDKIISEEDVLRMVVWRKPLFDQSKELKAVWAQWVKCRMQMKRPIDWGLFFQKQADWLQGEECGGVGGAIESMNASMRNGWQGLFAPKAPAPRAGSTYTPVKPAGANSSRPKASEYLAEMDRKAGITKP